MKIVISLVAVFIVVFIIFVPDFCESVPVGLSRTKATHVRPDGDKRKLKFVWPNSYYDIPNYRFPFYDEHGTGKLLYGFGGEKLYKYSIFKPIEGYYRRR
jgi:hypothetical protein